MSANIYTLHATQAAAEAEQQRLARMKRAWEAYHGTLPPPFTVTPNGTDDNVVANKARVIVNKGVSFLFERPIDFELGGDEGADTPAEEYLDRVWQRNRQATTLQKLAMNGSVCGHIFVKLVLRPGDVPRLIVLDPAMVSVEWDDADIELVTRYRVQWTALDPSTRRPLLRRQVIEPDGPLRWRILDQESGPDGLTWRTTATPLWPYPFPPIVDGQNLPLPNEYWGESDLESDVIDLIIARSRTLSNLARIIRFHGHPLTWGKGFSANQLNRSPDNTVVLPSADAELHNLEMVSDLHSHMEYDRRLDEAIHEIARIPAIATGKVENIGQLSGLAMQILFAPLVEKTETKRSTYGDFLTELNRRLLILGGYDAEAATPVSIRWPEILPGDPLTERNVALLDKELGVSTATLLSQLGYDPEREATQCADEAATAQDAQQQSMNAQPMDAMSGQVVPGTMQQQQPGMMGQMGQRMPGMMNNG